MEKDGEICVDFCRETGIIIPAFERTLDFEDRAEKVQKNLKKFLTSSKRYDIISKLSSGSDHSKIERIKKEFEKVLDKLEMM